MKVALEVGLSLPWRGHYCGGVMRYREEIREWDLLVSSW